MEYITKEDLLQMIELHDAYEKHVPVFSHTRLGGVFHSAKTICSSCLLPLVTFDGDVVRLPHSPGRLILSLTSENSAVFRLWVEEAKARGYNRAYADILAEMTLVPYDSHTRWAIIRNLGSGISEDMKVRAIDNRPADAVNVWRFCGPEERQRAYNSVLNCKDIEAIWSFNVNCLGKPCPDMLAAAKAAARSQDDMRLRDFIGWYERVEKCSANLGRKK